LGTVRIENIITRAVAAAVQLLQKTTLRDTEVKANKVMGSLSRKIKRKQKKKQKTKDLEQKLNMFESLGEECLTCQTSFDKKNKEMVQSWIVVVREKESKVNLYCPGCWEKAIKIVQQAENIIANQKEQQ